MATVHRLSRQRALRRRLTIVKGPEPAAMQFRHARVRRGRRPPLSLFTCQFCHFRQLFSAAAPASFPRHGFNNRLRHSTQPLPSRRESSSGSKRSCAPALGEPVSIAVLCQVAGVSERSLRNAFYDVRGMSPKRSARARPAGRSAARAELANGARGAVTTIATDHGFFELGRFASTYKAVFGESPSATLRSAAARRRQPRRRRRPAAGGSRGRSSSATDDRHADDRW